MANLGAFPSPLVLLNTPVLTSFGRYTFEPITLEQARALVASEPFESAIGHEATAQILTQLLRIEVPFRRVTYTQAPGQRALVFRLKQRLPEGEVIRSLEQLEAIGFEFGLLTREE